MHIHRARICAGLLGLALASCGDGESGDITGTGAGTMMTPAGGTVTSADGRVRLVFPAGAVAEPVAITIRHAAELPAHPLLVHGSAYTFGPSGIQFQAPVQLTIAYGELGGDQADAAAYVALHRWSGTDWVPASDIVADTVAGTVSGQLSGFSSYGAVIAEIASTVRDLERRLTLLIAEPIAQTAVEAMQLVAGLLARVDHPLFQTLAGYAIDAAGFTACEALKASVDAARLDTVDDYQKLLRGLRPVYVWSAMADALLGPGGCQPAVSLQQLHTEKLQEFVAFHVARLNQPDFTADFEPLLDEVKFVILLRGEAQLLGFGALEQQLRTEAQLPLLQRLRESAYVVCRSDAVHRLLGLLRREIITLDDVPYTENDLLTDLQFCATRLDWSLVDGNGATMASGVLGGGNTAGSVALTGAAAGLSTGTLRLAGDVRAFRCENGTFASDELSVTFGGVEVRRLQAGADGNFFAVPQSLDMAQILTTAGIDPAEAGIRRIEITRESLGCGLYIATVEPFPLSVIELAYPAEWSYFNDFSGPAGAEWSRQQIAVTPNGQRFLGLLNSETVTLTLSGLPTHQEVVIEFDLHIIGSWDGNGNFPSGDIVSFHSGALDFLATFANDPNDTQSYPGAYPASNGRGSGSQSVNTLGYTYSGSSEDWQDSTYRLSFTIPHSQATFSFAATGTVTSTGDEFWGIDNVRVGVR